MGSSVPGVGPHNPHPCAWSSKPQAVCWAGLTHLPLLLWCARSCCVAAAEAEAGHCASWPAFIMSKEVACGLAWCSPCLKIETQGRQAFPPFSWRFLVPCSGSYFAESRMEEEDGNPENGRAVASVDEAPGPSGADANVASVLARYKKRVAELQAEASPAHTVLP